MERNRELLSQNDPELFQALVGEERRQTRGIELIHAEEGERFFDALKGVTEPEAKRKIIGDTFIEVFNAKAAELGIQEHLLGQGTIYPDTVETGGTRRADTIKTHHNRVQVIEDLIARTEAARIPTAVPAGGESISTQS